MEKKEFDIGAIMRVKDARKTLLRSIKVSNYKESQLKKKEAKK